MSIKVTKTTKTKVTPTVTFESLEVGSFFLRPDTGNVYLKNESNQAVKVGQVGNDTPKQRTRSASYFNGLTIQPVEATLTVTVEV